MSDVQSTVEYRDIQGHPGYRVGSDGSVWSCKTRGTSRLNSTWKLMKLHRHSAGYMVVPFRSGRAKTCPVFFVHRLVLEAFVGPCPDGMECCHNDGDPANSVLTNLRWDTHKNNIGDSIKHGTNQRGETNGHAKLSERDIPIIVKRRNAGELFEDIGADFGVSESVIRKVYYGKTWRHVKRELPTKPKRRVF